MKNFLKILFPILSVAIISFNCSGSENLSNFKKHLSNERVSSLSEEFSVLVPNNWFSPIDNMNNYFDLWLINEDYSASISFIKINFEEISGDLEKSEIIKDLVKYSIINNKASFGKSFSQIGEKKFFELNEIPTGTYTFKEQEKFNRVVIFDLNNKYYESTAVILDSAKIDNFKLSEIQNSVIGSIY